MIESETDKSLSQSTLQQTSQKKFRGNESAILQREREINDIAKGIIELADIFKELQTMVIDQGTMLDRIDYNVENMAVNVKAAEKELIVVCSNHTAFSKQATLMFDYRQRDTSERAQSGRLFSCLFSWWLACLFCYS